MGNEIRYGELVAGLGGLVGSILTIRSAIRKRNSDAPVAEIAGPAVATQIEVRGIREKVKHIRKMALKGAVDPRVREFAASVLSQRCGDDWCVSERDYDNELREVYEAVRKHVRYTGDIHGKDTFQSPARTLQYGIGDCDDYSAVIGAIFKSIGYPVKFRVIESVQSRQANQHKKLGEPAWDHIYVMVGVPPNGPTRWVSMDASVDEKAGWEVPRSQISRKIDFDL